MLCMRSVLRISQKEWRTFSRLWSTHTKALKHNSCGNLLMKCLQTGNKPTQNISCAVRQSAEPLTVPTPDGEIETFSPKIEKLVSEISHLTLIEVADLTKALKQRLNLPDAPVMAMGALPQGAAAAAEEEEEAAPKQVQTSFTVKLLKFDEKQKVPIIKEIKNLIEGMNLVQAKKFVESAPVVVKADVGKDEAEKLKEALSKVGGELEIV